MRHPGAELPEKAQAALDAGQPPDLLFGLQADVKISQWAYDDRLVDVTGMIGPLASLFDPDVLEAASLLNGRTGQRALYALPMAWGSDHLHVWTSLLEQAGSTLADIPKEWEAFWAFWCDRVQPAVRQAIGCQNIWAVGLPMSATVGDTYVQFQINQALRGTPTLANMIEGGRTPVLPAAELEALGFALAIYPTGALYTATKAAKAYMDELKAAGTPMGRINDMIPFENFNQLIGLPEYNRLEQRYQA